MTKVHIKTKRTPSAGVSNLRRQQVCSAVKVVRRICRDVAEGRSTTYIRSVMPLHARLSSRIVLVMTDQRAKVSQSDFLLRLSSAVDEASPDVRASLLRSLAADGAPQQIVETLGEQYVSLLLSEVGP